MNNTSDATQQAATLSAADSDDVGLGSVDNNSTATIRAVAAATSGTVGPVTITASGGAGGGASLYQGTGAYNNSNTGFYMDSAGNFSLKDKLAFNGTDLVINGSGTFTGDLSIGSGDSIFKADSNGIYLGDATFADAEFRVTPAGAVTAESITITSGDYLNIEAGGDAYFSSDRVKFTKNGSISIVGNASGTAGLVLYDGTDGTPDHSGDYWSVFKDSTGNLGHMYNGSVSQYWKTNGNIQMGSGKYLWLGLGVDAGT